MAFYQGRRRGSGFEPNTQINITALVDVLLVTLIIFMLVSPTLEHGIDVQLPVAKPFKMVTTKPLVISMSAKGALFLNNAPVTAEVLKRRLAEVAKSAPDSPVVLRGDAGIPYGELIKVLDAVRTAGLVNVGLATRSEGG